MFIFGDLRCILERQSSKQVERPGNKTGPSRLMAGPETSAIVSMEVLIKQDVVLLVRTLLEDLAAAKDRTSCATSNNVMRLPEPVGHSILKLSSRKQHAT